MKNIFTPLLRKLRDFFFLFTILNPVRKTTMRLLVAFFFFFGFLKETKAQYVTIPDANFRNFLQANYPSCMSGGMLDTTCTAVVNATTQVDISNQGITDLTGIQYFKNLKYLYCYSNQLTSLPVLPASLTTLTCYLNQLASLPALPASLTDLECSNNQLTSLPILPASLTTLDCIDNQLTSLPVLPASLTQLLCDDNQLTSLPTLPASLISLWCENNQLTSLPALPASLRDLLCSSNQLTSFPVLPVSLKTLWGNYNQFTSFPVLPASLRSLQCSGNQLTSLPALPASLTFLGCVYNQLTTLPALPDSLWKLFCSNNQLTTLPALPGSLSDLFCGNNQLTTLPALPGSLSELSCVNNQLICLPLLSNKLQNLYASGNSISCLLNIPTQLGFTSDIGYFVCGPSNDVSGCAANYNKLRGNIYTDANSDCKVEAAEKRIASVLVKATPGSHYGISDTLGKYNIWVDSGSVNYTLVRELNSVYSKLLIKQQCASSYNVSLSGTSQDTCCFNFADSIKQCFVLDINIQKTSARQCIRGTTYVKFTNYGILSASGTEVKIEYPSHIFPIASTPMWSSIQGSVLTYNIGTIQAGQSGKITITDSVDCAVDLSHQVECIKATISPSSNCVADNPSWDRSSMKVTGTCQSGNAHFIITNDGTGDMGSSLQYRVYENDTLIYTGTYQLKSGENFTVDYPAQGQSIRLEADQNSLHPGNSRPRATITNCGIPVAGTTATNLVTTASLDDLDEETAMACPMITNSHDPNEKLAIPSGIGSAHNIAAGEEIEYVIGFQNTGNDTAYTVTVIDTLDAGLDAASFTQSASSHPYTLGISGKGQAVLTFRFDNINLPDSTTNNLASSGLVSFRMTVPSSALTGTVIKNKAYIYFDYNAPILTNETMHTVDNSVPTALSKGSAVQVGSVVTGLTGKRSTLAVKIYPNPTSGMVTLEMPESASSSEMRVYSLIGVLQKSVLLDKSIAQQVNLEDIQEGLYIYEILQEGERKAGGMLKIK
jgi:uncharacterized repeat protein (TIGR01451 family)